MGIINKKPYDYIIVGGGISGLSCAYWLKKQDKSLKVAIIDKGKIKKYNIEKQLCNLTVGSLNHLYRIYKLHGIERVMEVFEYFKENLELIDDELEVLNKNSYVSLYDSGTINLMEEGDHNEMGYFKSFVHELGKFDFPIEEIKNKNWEYGVKYCHDGGYEARKFTDTILKKLNSSVDFFEGSTCKTINRQIEDISILTAGGDQIIGNKIILANSNSLTQLLPELKDEVETVDSFVFKFDSEINNLEFYNYANHKSDGYFVKLVDGFYYAQHGNIFDSKKELAEEDASQSFEDFSNKIFPGIELDETVKTQMAYTLTGLPVEGQSKKNPQLYYLGGFSGQSKLYAFKMAKELVEKMRS